MGRNDLKAVNLPLWKIVLFSFDSFTAELKVVPPFNTISAWPVLRGYCYRCDSCGSIFSGGLHMASVHMYSHRQKGCSLFTLCHMFVLCYWTKRVNKFSAHNCISEIFLFLSIDILKYPFLSSITNLETMLDKASIEKVYIFIDKRKQFITDSVSSAAQESFSAPG